jgi:hypothetical protein
VDGHAHRIFTISYGPVLCSMNDPEFFHHTNDLDPPRFIALR